MYDFLLRHLQPRWAGVAMAIWYGVLIALVLICAVAPRGAFTYMRL
ncbi:hypothetical protein NK718_21005 [Alsobacter sp. SYSU M60028]|uniref:ABC transporter permease n=1 Tax=Alsobacter ponti TaxID=2962936 RepID=A0ABT1LHM6_9HYPH|nr:hypothetical protein [Alsobacter ponti]MCP8941011.1 hypothetical protein [Alsobacter ponti]